MTITVGEHWMHQRFVANLINASHGRELNEAGKEWQLYRYGYNEATQRCHLCNTQIKESVELRNIVNQNILVIGHDCYDKLVGFLVSGRVEHQLPDRKDYIRKLREYTKKILPNETVLGWIYERLSSGNMPEEIALIVRTIKAIGFAPSYAEADRLVEYYRQTRFPQFPRPSFLAPKQPTKVTPRVGITSAPKRIKREPLSFNFPTKKEVKTQGLIVCEERPYILLKLLGRWKKYDIRSTERLPTGDYGLFDVEVRLPNVFHGKKLDKQHFVKIISSRPVRIKPDCFPVVDFIIPGKNRVEEKSKYYVGRIGGKIVLSGVNIWKPGRYICFLLGEERNYIRVWAIRLLELNER